MTNVPPRVQVPASVVQNEMFTVKALINHPMETGFRVDEQGRTIPRKIIHTFRCSYDGIVVFSADLRESVAANPYLEFHLRATRSGSLDFEWEEDSGATTRLKRDIVVTPK